MEGKGAKARENPLPVPQMRARKNMETYDDLGSGTDGGIHPPSAMEEPPTAAAAAPEPYLIGADALPAPHPGTAAGARKRKAPGMAMGKAAKKPLKPQVEEPIQLPVYHGLTKEFLSVEGNDLVEDCSDIYYAENKCAHVIGELPLLPQSMSLVDLQLWIFKLFRLHPETQDLDIKGFFKQHRKDLTDDESSDPECPLEYYSWDVHYFRTDKCWSSFANKLKRKRNVTQKFMLYVQSSEIKHYHILLKAVNDDYSQLATVLLPGTKGLASRFGFGALVEDPTMTADEIADYLTRHYGERISPGEAWRAKQFALERKFGTFYDSHNFAPRLLKEIARKNPGGFVDIKDAEVAGCKDFRVLQRMFWAFGPCLMAFCTCCPVLCIKGTPLCGKYQGMLLTAVALDAKFLRKLAVIS
ncbi:uncharacterized protein LOC123429571 [Hordeum vulgare subsp. vulgare]|uniref:uncharacterized protein LOC123429571 n=1 Tax=Hordeum vulgare subsp. vulgare TaxID=112509 RepID=UPI001B859A24|nr:uncharacterized protein LOC123429571 [Hordeum vulgare subsp. vulgare]